MLSLSIEVARLKMCLIVLGRALGEFLTQILILLVLHWTLISLKILLRIHLLLGIGCCLLNVVFLDLLLLIIVGESIHIASL